ncbi:MAG: hypothetical protein WAT71_12095 [Ignavibacteria bacterium]
MIKKFLNRIFKRKGPYDFYFEKFSNGDGLSFENAVKIQSQNSMQGISDEYLFINTFYGKREIDWFLEGQSLVSHNDINYDVLKIKLKDGKILDIHFDISNFFGKF